MIKATNTIGSLEGALGAASLHLYMAVARNDIKEAVQYRDLLVSLVKQVRSITSLIKEQEAAAK